MVKIAEVSKEIQYEVFKRDHFTCQDCGKKVPAAVLYVGYDIDPADGGTDDIGNLRTKCYDCSDLKAPEMLAERRHQFEMMMKWKEGWKNFKEDTNALVIEYVNSRIGPHHSLNRTGEQNVIKALKMNTLDIVLDTIDEVYDTTARFNEEGDITRESAEKFITNIGKYLYVKSQPPVERQLYLIRGMCRNIYSYWNDKKGMQFLRAYVEALRQWDYSEEAILKDLKDELTPKLKSCKNWSQFRGLLTDWTNSIYKQIQQRPKDEPVERHALKQDYIESFPYHDWDMVESNIDIAVQIYRGFPEWTAENEVLFKVEFLKAARSYLSDLYGRYLHMQDVPKYEEDEELQYYNDIPIDKFFGLEDTEMAAPLSFSARVEAYENTFATLFSRGIVNVAYHQNAFDFATGVKMVDQAIKIVDGRIVDTLNELVQLESMQ